jgi:hypothetical protein
MEIDGIPAADACGSINFIHEAYLRGERRVTPKDGRDREYAHHKGRCQSLLYPHLPSLKKTGTDAPQMLKCAEQAREQRMLHTFQSCSLCAKLELISRHQQSFGKSYVTGPVVAAATSQTALTLPHHRIFPGGQGDGLLQNGPAH